MNRIVKKIGKKIIHVLGIEGPFFAAWDGYKKWKYSGCEFEDTQREEHTLISEIGLFERGFTDYVIDTSQYLKNIKSSEVISEMVDRIQEITQCKKYKGIIIYPHIVAWEPLQTPQQLLREFAKEGWLCFFCETVISTSEIRRVEENLYITSESDLTQAISDQEVIFLLTWMGSLPFLDQFPKKKIWYNILDDISIFSLYDKIYELTHYEMVNRSNWISYVAKPLLSFTGDRSDAFYLPNGCTPEDFTVADMQIPQDMQPIVNTGHKIIGYYGMLAEWMDYELVYEIAQRCPEYEFVFIGTIATNIDKITNVQNIHILGKKRYVELPYYAACFDIATIPFKINSVMDCVSPIKFYEYCACGKPVISSRMKELEAYECEYIACIDDIDGYQQKINEFLSEKIKESAKNKAPLIAKANSWNNRVKTMEGVLLNEG